MNQMEKAKKLMGVMAVIHRDREARLEAHLGVDTNDCRDCHYWKAYDGWKVDYCPEAQRLANRIRSVVSRARVVTLLVLEAVHARG